MNRITAILMFVAVLALPAIVSADCGCGCDAPAVTACDCGCAVDACDTCQDRCTRKRLKLVRVCKEVCRTKRVCTTDCCGCKKMTRVKVKKMVPRLRLVRVEVPKRTRCAKPCCDPCSSCDSCGCGCN